MQGDDGSLYVASPPGVRAPPAMTSEQQDYPCTKDIHAVLLSFAQLAIGCSNPTSRATGFWWHAIAVVFTNVRKLRVLE